MGSLKVVIGLGSDGKETWDLEIEERLIAETVVTQRERGP
jgi:hypothetical protein